ncbi:MAG: DUF4254 domain-containing protein [Pirellulaceae bacterium]
MLDVEKVRKLQADTIVYWHNAPISMTGEGIYGTICRQHSFNFLLWHEEDIARSKTATDFEIANVKRAIDRFNQQRNDWIERIDDEIDSMLVERGIRAVDGAKLHTETPGSAIDRLSIMALRIYHLYEQLDRAGADKDHWNRVSERIVICEQQASHLAAALSTLLSEIQDGKVWHRTFRQFKMYNDPTMNPYLNGQIDSRRAA